MTINDIDTKDIPSGKETVISTPTPSANPNVLLQPIAEVLGGDVNKHSKELTAINDFLLKDNPKAGMEDIAWGVRELLMRMGTPKFGESNLDRLYQYVYLRTEKDKIDNRLNILGGKHE
jgi:hypothetical protein